MNKMLEFGGFALLTTLVQFFVVLLGGFLVVLFCFVLLNKEVRALKARILILPQTPLLG